MLYFSYLAIPISLRRLSKFSFAFQHKAAGQLLKTFWKEGLKTRLSWVLVNQEMIWQALSNNLSKFFF